MTTWNILIIAIVISTNVVFAAIKEWRINITNPGNNNHVIPLRIHYPNDNSKQYPLMIFQHGGIAENTWYNYIWQNMVPFGVIVVMPDDYVTNLTKNDMTNYSQDQRYTLDWIRSIANNNKSTPIYNMISNKSIATGHSDGASCTSVSISNYTDQYQNFIYSFDAAMTLSSCGQPQVKQSYKWMTKPIFVMTATHDCICQAKIDSIPDYYSIDNSTCKFLADITNGTHCMFMDAPPENQETCKVLDHCGVDQSYDISHQQQMNDVIKYMKLWVNATVMDNDRETQKMLYQEIWSELVNDNKTNVMGLIDTTYLLNSC